MKKLTIAVTAVLLSFGAFAQTTIPSPTTTSAQTDKKQDMKDLRKDEKDVRHDKRMRKYELKHGEKAKANEETKGIRADNKGIKSDAQDLRKDGVKHPFKRADHQIHHHTHK